MLIIALFRSTSDRIIVECMFDKNRHRFMVTHYQEMKRTFGYLSVDNRPDTPVNKQLLNCIFGSCHVCSSITNRRSQRKGGKWSFLWKEERQLPHAFPVQSSCRILLFLSCLVWSELASIAKLYVRCTSLQKPFQTGNVRRCPQSNTPIPSVPVFL